MNAHTDLIDRYVDAWNETDGERRRRLVAATFAADADYRDPLAAASGHDNIDAMIRAVQARFAHHTFRRSTDVDGFGNRLRFSWDLVTPAGEVLVKGSDFGVLDAHGRLQTVTGFLDQLPVSG